MSSYFATNVEGLNNRSSPRTVYLVLCFCAALQFSRDWASGGVEANVTYKSFSSAVVRAELGLQVGLSGIDVTLRGMFASGNVS